MSVAIDRVAAVLLVSLRHDLGESYHGPREKGYRPTIMGNKLLGDQWQKSRKEVIEEIRGALAYYFAEELISPGINLLLGSRSQDMWVLLRDLVLQRITRTSLANFFAG